MTPRNGSNPQLSEEREVELWHLVVADWKRDPSGFTRTALYELIPHVLELTYRPTNRPVMGKTRPVAISRLLRELAKALKNETFGHDLEQHGMHECIYMPAYPRRTRKQPATLRLSKQDEQDLAMMLRYMNGESVAAISETYPGRSKVGRTYGMSANRVRQRLQDVAVRAYRRVLTMTWMEWIGMEMSLLGADAHRTQLRKELAEAQYLVAAVKVRTAVFNGEIAATERWAPVAVTSRKVKN